MHLCFRSGYSNGKERDPEEVLAMAVAQAPAENQMRNPAYQVFLLLRLGFTVAPILFGIDKFFNWMVDWPKYLAGWVNGIVPGTAQQFMYAVGVIEIVAGLLGLVIPRFGAPLVAVWLGGIIVNLLTKNPPQFYDIALRDLGLMFGALALTRLAWMFRPAARAGASAPQTLRRAA
jgi:uncharacterized membrane protein YphA (DoxX/SURF4 family)